MAGFFSQITTDDVWEWGTVFDSPERVVTQMKRFMHQMRIGGLEHKKVMQLMELFAKYVMPALRKEEDKMESATAAV